MTDYQKLKTYLDEYGQSHLLKFWDDISEEEKTSLAEQINEIDMKEVVGYFNTAQESLDKDVVKLDDRMKPLPNEKYNSSVEVGDEELEMYNREGLERIAEGQVGVLLMAGGQGSRLGVSYPKGMYKVGILSDKSLFTIQAERIIKLQSLAEQQTGKKGTITWYIMTSEHTIEPTKKYFQENNFFGLKEEDILMFNQGKLPCFDFEGKILLSDKSQISLAPNGNGGLYRALRDRGILDDARKRGVKYLHAHSVDNILVKTADPVFIGYCIKKNADCGAKVVRKTAPDEAVGVVCKVDDLFQVVEYSEITNKTAELINPATNQLMFNAGNICNHFFTTKFLENIAANHESELTLHVAKKKIPYINDDGQIVKPTTPNGIKIEKFVFDVFRFTEDFVCWEVERHVEFSALKNADDAKKDCPSTARSDLFKLHKIYIEKAGGKVEGDEIEISPMVSYAGEGLEDLVKGKVIKTPKLLN